MSELVTDEMVDTLARGRYEDHVRCDKYPANWPTWDDLHGVFKESIVAGARREAEVIAPLIRTKALHEAADFVDTQRYEDNADDLRQVRDRLHSLAEGTWP